MTKLFSKIEANCKALTEKTAIICGEQMVSYSMLSQKIELLAEHLLQSGYQHQQNVYIILPNSIEFVVVTLAAAKLNAKLIPLPASYTKHNLRCAFERIPPHHVIGWSGAIEACRSLPSSCIGDVISWLSMDSSDAGYPLDNSLITKQSEKASYDLQIAPDDTLPFILTMTSGSTGLPKPIALSQFTKLKRAESAISLYSVTESDVTLIGTPLYHSLAERLLFVSLLSGGTLVILPRFTMSLWLSAIISYKVTFTMAVSSQLKQLLNYADSTKEYLRSLRCIVSSSSLLNYDDKNELLRLINCDFHECYGTSEMAVITNIKFDKSNKNKSVGKPIPGAEIKIINDSGEYLPIHKIGEIVCKSELEFSSYYQAPELTDEAFTNGYFKTGDLGFIDEAGQLHFVGRKKELIITGGINVYPKDVEDIIQKHHKKLNCVAFGLEDDKLGEIVALAIESNETSIRDIKLTCIEHLEAYQIPHKFFIFKELPLNSTSKIDKKKITSAAISAITTSKQHSDTFLIDKD